MISLVPVSSSDPGAIIVEEENKIYVSTGGHQVLLNIRVSDWDPGATGLRLGTFQAGIDSTGYATGVQGMLSPWQPPCTNDAQCEALMGPLGTAFTTRGGCGVYGVPAGACAAGFIDETRTDHITGGSPWMDRSTMDYRYGGWVPAILSPGHDTYAGTLAVDVPPNAVGSFTIDFKHGTGHTYMLDEGNNLIPLGGIEPATIIVGAACCLPNGRCIMTEYQANECADLGGDPQGPGTNCLTAVCHPLKWSQPPMYDPDSAHRECYWGWDERSDYDVGPIVADDWACDSEQPVTDIHWWGSYIGWSGEDPPPVTPGSFHIGIWTDIPEGPGEPFSHPGVMIEEWTVPRAELNERPVACDFHPDFMAQPDSCFRYDFIIPEAQWFYQEPACSVYWVGISAVYAGDPGPNPWGWKTREHYFGDDAVKISSPTTPVVDSTYGDGLPIEHPAGVSRDMAFVLTDCCLSDPPARPAGEAGYDKSRYISMVPGNPGRQTALRVTFTSLPAPYDTWNGVQMWVQEPTQYCENSGVPQPPCPPETGGLPEEFTGATLGCEPYFMDWSTVGVLHVFHEGVIPDGTYAVQIIGEDCYPAPESCYSDPLCIYTSRWADLVKNRVTGWTPPNGRVDIFDLTASWEKFLNLGPLVRPFPPVQKPRADLDWETPNQMVSITDTTFLLDAAQCGEPYPPEGFDPPGPPPCSFGESRAPSALATGTRQLCPPFPVCGDGNETPPEECDDGGESADCDADCTDVICGDGTINRTAGEQCDPPDAVRCDAACQLMVVPTAVFSLVPTGNDPTGALDPGVTIIGNQIIVPTGARRVFLDILLSNWDPTAAGTLLNTYLATIDSAGYASGTMGTLTPATVPCAADLTCQAALGQGSVCCALRGGVDCTAGFIDETRPTHVFAGEDAPCVTGLATLDYAYGCTWQTVLPPSGVADPGVPRYAGTLVLDVPADAAGTFTIGLKKPEESLLLDDDYLVIPMVDTVPAKITVATACCLPNGRCIMTEYLSNECADRGGDPQGPGTHCGTTVCHPLKWSQPPMYDPDSAHRECYWGWDELSDYDVGPIVADDWACMSERAVTDVHWWGSYIGWSGVAPPSVTPDSFHIGIWTDVPFDPGEPDSFSHPGTMIWHWTVEYANLNERAVGCDFHPDFTAQPESCFRYDFAIPRAQWFYQEPACSIYWISIAAKYLGVPQNAWGWKTRRPEWTDDAVRISSPVSPIPNSEYSAGEPIEHPAGVSWDTAFVLGSRLSGPGSGGGEGGYNKVGYISMDPGDPARQTALRVTLTSLPAPFDDLNGTRMWVGEPQEISENAGKTDHQPGWPDFMSANLQCEPYCMDFGELDVLHVTAAEIIPNAVYDVQAIDCQSDFDNESAYSEPLTISTSRWGDLVGTCAVIPCSPPDGVVGVPTDVTACLDKFKNLPNAVLKSRADIEPNVRDWLVNISDVTLVLDAFRGCPYPAMPDPPAYCPGGWPGPMGCSGPRLGAYSNSGCLPGSERAVDSSTEPCSEDDQIDLAPGPGTLTVIHRNASYNCCQDDIRVSLSVAGNVLQFTEEEVPPGGYCHCICCFNVESTVIDLEPGEYTVEYCWLDYEMGPRCYVEDVVIPEPQPRVGEYFNSGCLGQGHRSNQEPCLEPDGIELSAEPGTLHVLHNNATYNCCPDDIVVLLSMEGNVIRLTEEEVLTLPCACLCCYNVEATVVDLPPGEYTVELCWYDYETFGQKCHQQDIVIP
ncbi:MAG: hypothetical protein JSU86_09655 [Phycisphaerales bacterium]|nr:MAG: hypothetical protein JSU86_09655 [Phycisphaerales bacterium]